MAGIGWPGANCSHMRRPSSKTCKGATSRCPESFQLKSYAPLAAAVCTDGAASGHAGQPAQPCSSISVSAISKLVGMKTSKNKPQSPPGDVAAYLGWLGPAAPDRVVRTESFVVRAWSGLTWRYFFIIALACVAAVFSAVTAGWLPLRAACNVC